MDFLFPYQTGFTGLSGYFLPFQKKGKKSNPSSREGPVLRCSEKKDPLNPVNPVWQKGIKHYPVHPVDPVSVKGNKRLSKRILNGVF
ncbi:MAG: hypothetical protein JRJ38_07945 [Deltaproteobacteria bacterium]|nr:hypothetical protein [Deltaproteobacteria bacterium]